MGYPGLFLLITLESTMVPIPSELVMPFAGYLAFTGQFSLPVIIIINSVAAVTGSALSYWLKRLAGKPLLLKYGRYLLIRKKDIDRTESYCAPRQGDDLDQPLLAGYPSHHSSVRRDRADAASRSSRRPYRRHDLGNRADHGL